MNNNKNQIKYFFDKEADVLYFSKRKPSVKDVSQEIGDGIVARIDSKTKKVIGFTVLNFLKRQLKTSIKLPLTAELELAR